MEKKEIKLKLKNVKAEVLYHKYRNVDVNTLLVSFNEKRRVISTLAGYNRVRFVANTYQPDELSQIIMKDYAAFEADFPKVLGIPRGDLSFLSTGANMNNVAVCEMSYQGRIVCCLATGGVGNALRSGVDEAHWIEQDGVYAKTFGTINIILLTNVTLTDGALAKTIITATEAKTAALQDMDARSSVSPENRGAQLQTGFTINAFTQINCRNFHHLIKFSNREVSGLSFCQAGRMPRSPDHLAHIVSSTRDRSVQTSLPRAPC